MRGASDGKAEMARVEPPCSDSKSLLPLEDDDIVWSPDAVLKPQDEAYQDNEYNR
jgi:hypothetical protein